MKDIRYLGKLDFRIDNVGYVKVMRDKDFAVPYRSGKEKYSVILPISGSMSYHFPESRETVLLYPGDIMYIPKKHPYIATYLQDGTVMNLFNFDTDTGMISEGFEYPKKRTLPELARRICTELESNSENMLFLASRIYEAICALEKREVQIPKKYKRILPDIEEIKTRFEDNRKISYYAELCDMSESNFRKLFTEYVGKSPIEYRNCLRISRARSMIDSGEYTALEAAYLCGFNNMSVFYEAEKGMKK